MTKLCFRLYQVVNSGASDVVGRRLFPGLETLRPVDVRGNTVHFTILLRLSVEFVISYTVILIVNAAASVPGSVVFSESAGVV